MQFPIESLWFFKCYYVKKKLFLIEIKTIVNIKKNDIFYVFEYEEWGHGL